MKAPAIDIMRSAVRHPNRQGRAASRAAEGIRFKDTRLLCCLSVRDAGKLFRVTERTIRNWEAGRVKVPYTAFKLMRILRGYELPGQAWKGYRLKGDTLWSPEGLAFKSSDQTWWSLTVRMAHEFRRMMATQRAVGVAAGQAVGAQAGAPAAETVLQSAHGVVIASEIRVTPPPLRSASAIDPPHPTGGVALRVGKSPCSNTGFVSLTEGRSESLLPGVRP